LEHEEKNENAEFCVKEVQYIQAEVVSLSLWQVKYDTPYYFVVDSFCKYMALFLVTTSSVELRSLPPHMCVEITVGTPLLYFDLCHMGWSKIEKKPNSSKVAVQFHMLSLSFT
jgi:hypothetical protein